MRTLKTYFVLSILFILSTNSYAQTPEWAKGAVWYQIFPERFNNAMTENDPTKSEVMGDKDVNWAISPWTSDWYTLQPWEKEWDKPFYELVLERRYGGDLIGVTEKLDYLQELGVDVIYFNPIFEAHSLHKYDATTYHHIDNNFGPDAKGDMAAIRNEKHDPATWTFTSADKAFLELIREAHQRDIRVVIDGVFNHGGFDFWALEDLRANQQNSIYRDWLDVISWDDPATPDTNEFDYKGWWGYKIHPEFKENENGFVDDGVKQYFFNVTRRWMDPNGDGDPSDGVDGWRLDVAPDVSNAFWEEWYPFVKSINPEAFTLGEVWDKATEYIENKRFDAVMNYPFARISVAFFFDKERKISASEFDKRLTDLRATYPDETNFVLMNLIDGHDTDRVSSMIRNPDRDYNSQENLRVNPNYDPRKPSADEVKIQKLFTLFQMTYPGAPTIYYGDEAGMWGGKDPDCRMPMVWPEMIYDDETYTLLRPDLKEHDAVAFDRDLFAYYKSVIALRKEHPALRTGTYKTEFVDDSVGIMAYSRSKGDEKVYIVLNNGERAASIDIPVTWAGGSKVTDALNIVPSKEYRVEAGRIRLVLDGKWGAVLVKK